MRKRKKFSLFNNFNRGSDDNLFTPNYSNEFENEFSEEMFNRNRLDQRGQEHKAENTQDKENIDHNKHDQNPNEQSDADEPRNWQ